MPEFRRAAKTAGSKTKAPGPVARAVKKKASIVTRAATPYAAVLVIAAIALPIGETWVFLLAVGGAGVHALQRVWEACGWHRSGGRAARRKRRRYQGPATWLEKRARLSARAIRKRAHVTRPATERPHKLPAEELGVLIGESVRRPR